MQLDKRLKPCPICGAKAFVSHDIVDGFEFGWSVGCPRACIKDGIHGFDDYDSFKRARLTIFCLNSKEQAIEIWNQKGGVMADQICGECNYHRCMDGEWTCQNEGSDYFTDYTDYEDSCDMWEQRGID